MRKESKFKRNIYQFIACLLVSNLEAEYKREMDRVRENIKKKRDDLNSVSRKAELELK